MVTPRTFSTLFGMLLLTSMGLLAACNNDQNRSYCDSSGCYTCNGNQCYPTQGNPNNPNPPSSACADDSNCPAGEVCNLGTCQSACQADSNCTSGDVCISGRCRPSGSASCGVAGAICNASGSPACGANQRCMNGSCGSLCPNGQCANGQVCSGGACEEDPSPAQAQCLFDLDCGAAGGFKCVNAYCLPRCSADTDCSGVAVCLKGLCRGGRLSTAG